jgi:hypothetical protein
MFKQASLEVYEFLKTDIVFSGIFGNRIFPLYAPDTVGDQTFATYKIQSGTNETKDTKSVNVSLFLWFKENQITELFEAHDDVLEVLESNNKIEFQEDASFTDVDPEFQKPYAQINFKYIIN